MKKMNRFYGVVVVFAAVVASVSCTEVKEKYEYFRISQASCSFYQADNNPMTIDVESPERWNVETNVSWLKISDITDYSFSVIAEDNETGEERTASITVSSAGLDETIAVNQLGLITDYPRFRQTDFVQNTVISPNGKYVGGVKSALDGDDIIYTPTIIEIETGDEIELATYSSSLYLTEYGDAITDDGMFFLSDQTAGCSMAFDKDGNMYEIKAPEGFMFKPTIQAVSGDGKYWVGYCNKFSSAEGAGCYPVKWTDGEPELLEWPEKNFRNEKFVYGIMARGMSEDGSVIYGSTWDNNDFGMLYWKDGKVKWVGEDVRKVKPVTMIDASGNKIPYNLVDGMTIKAECLNISPNGRWLAGTYRTENLSDGDNAANIAQSSCAAFFDTENERTYVFSDLGGIGLTATDDGIGFVGIGTVAISNTIVVDIESKTSIGSMTQWIQDKYGVTLPDCCLMYVPGDENMLFGARVAAVADGTMHAIYWYMDARDY